MPRVLGRPAPASVATGLAELHELVIGVSHLSQRRTTGHEDLTDLAEEHQRGVAAFLVRQSCTGTGGSAEAGTASGFELDSVDRHAGRDVLERHAASDVGLDRIGGAQHGHSGLEADEGQDVPTLAVAVLDESDVARTVRVVLDGDDGRRIVVAVSLEVDDTVAAFVLPPRPRTVILPWLFRPPFLLSGRRSDFSGLDVVTSSWRFTDALRRPGVVGL